jgi:hypothetical protein
MFRVDVILSAIALPRDKTLCRSVVVRDIEARDASGPLTEMMVDDL